MNMEYMSMQMQFFDIRDFGAKADGTTLNTAAIQAAIDACHAGSGGRVLVSGGVFLTGTITLKSHVTLHVEAGSTLLGSDRIGDYTAGTFETLWPERPFRRLSMGQRQLRGLIQAEDADDITIEGAGTIDGQGRYGEVFPNADDPHGNRPFLIRLQDCRHVRLRDITLKDPACFTTFFVRCSHVTIDGVSVRSRGCRNGDGLDFDGGEDIFITRCRLDAGDDCISLKTFDPAYPCRRVTISDCIMSSEWGALRIGPEACGDVSDVTVSNCVFRDCTEGLKIQSCGGAVLEQMVFSNIVMENVRRPIFVTLNRYNFSVREGTVRPPIGKVRHLTFRGIRARVEEPGTGWWQEPCAAVVGLPRHPIEDVELDGVHLAFPGGGTRAMGQRVNVPELLDFMDLWPEVRHFSGSPPASGLFLRHVNRAAFRDSGISLNAPDGRPCIYADDVADVEFSHIRAWCAGDAPGLLKLADARQVTTERRVLNTPDGEAEILVPLTADEEARLADFRQRSAAYDAQMVHIAALIDAVDLAKTVLILPVEWQFRTDPVDNEAEAGCRREDGSGWHTIRTDASWTSQEYEAYTGTAWYATAFTAPSLPSGSPIYLYFPAVASACRVWVDGMPAGGFDTPSEYQWRYVWAVDVTALIKPGKEQRLVVQVTCHGKEGGILQPVELRMA